MKTKLVKILSIIALTLISFPFQLTTIKAENTTGRVRPGFKVKYEKRDMAGNLLKEWYDCDCWGWKKECYCYTVYVDVGTENARSYSTWSDNKPCGVIHPDNGEEGSIGNTEIVFDGDRKVIIVEFLPSKGRIDSKTKLEPEWLIRDFDPGTAFLKRHDIKVIEDQFVKPRIVDGKVIFEMRTGKLEDSIMDAKKVETQEIERKEPEPQEIKEIEPIKR